MDRNEISSQPLRGEPLLNAGQCRSVFVDIIKQCHCIFPLHNTQRPRRTHCQPIRVRTLTHNFQHECTRLIISPSYSRRKPRIITYTPTTRLLHTYNPYKSNYATVHFLNERSPDFSQAARPTFLITPRESRT